MEPGPRHTLLVNGAPFYPLGWYQPGECDNEATDYASGRATLRADLDRMRRHGTNVVYEIPSANGRLMPLRLPTGWYNWYALRYDGPDGAPHRAGHPRPGAYAEGLLWLLDRLAEPDAEGRTAFTVIGLASFIRPGYTGTPYGTDDRLPCATYAAFIEAERAEHAADDPARAARIPAVACAGAPDVLPFWEWNLRYLVQAVRDHPALIAWHVIDEAEGVSYRHLFGLSPSGTPPPPYAGPESLPTPDLLRYAYERIIAFETEGRPAGYQRHPVVLDIRSPEAFFADRFPWAKEGRSDDPRRPAWESGPFDRRPDGRYATPGDILGLEASSQIVNTRAAGDLPAHPAYTDPNYQSQAAAMLTEVAERDDLWTTWLFAGQAQLPGEGPFAVSPPPPCAGSHPRTRLLNDRDLVWHLLTSQINGLRGFLFYASGLMPRGGPGGEQLARSHRLLAQFRQARLDSVFAAPTRPDGEGWRVETIEVEELTNYVRSDPAFIGPADADAYHAPPSAFSRAYRFTDPADYRAGRFGRSFDRTAYGQPTASPTHPVPYPDHRLLRAALHVYDGTPYLFLSNVYDARIEVQLSLTPDVQGRDSQSRLLEEGRFNLDANGRLAWDTPARSRTFFDAEAATLRVALAPYEVRFFRWPPG